MFCKRELTDAIVKLHNNKSPGDDEIANELIKHLSETGTDKILALFNASWAQGRIPNTWREATIIPILKPGKPEAEPGSYRPISLTSCLCKLMERLVLNRLNRFLKDNNIMDPDQAGFEGHRSTEDQLVRIHQDVLDGFSNKKKSLRTLMVLIDFSRAFDTVWRAGLLSKLIEYKTPRCMTKWIKEFLSARSARVEIEGARSKKFTLEEGVPQGGVISPKLFTIFINDITKDISPEVKKSLFADDLALWVQAETPEECERKMQEALSRIEYWASQWAMKINEGKCEYILFSTWNQESKWQGDLKINGTNIARNDNPTFLGVKFDWNMTFNEQVNQITKKMKSRMRILKATAHKTWGCRNEDLRALYIGYIGGRVCISNMDGRSK